MNEHSSTVATSEVPLHHRSYKELTNRERRRRVVVVTLRTGLNIAPVVALYFLVPLDHSSNLGAALELALGVMALAAIIALQVKAIVGSDRPISRAVEALAMSVPLYVLFFAMAYFLMARANHASFGVPISRTDAMYFSSTVFTTVGFGDITAKTEAARLVVTVQMWLDLVFLGLVVRVVVNAVKFNQQRNVPGANG